MYVLVYLNDKSELRYESFESYVEVEEFLEEGDEYVVIHQDRVIEEHLS